MACSDKVGRARQPCGDGLVCFLRTFGSGRLRLLSMDSLARELLTLKTSCENCASFVSTPSTADLALSALCLPVLAVSIRNGASVVRGGGGGAMVRGMSGTRWPSMPPSQPQPEAVTNHVQPTCPAGANPAWGRRRVCDALRARGGLGSSAGAALGVDAHPWPAS